VKLYEVVFRQQYFNQECLNRFNYGSTLDPSDRTGAFALATGLGVIPVLGEIPADTLMHDILAIQASQVEHIEVEVRNLYDNEDFFTVPYSPAQIGLQSDAGDPASPALAYGFFSNRVRTDVRRGQKRFVGVNEDYMGSGGNVGGAVLAPIAALAEKMGEQVNDPSPSPTATFVPVILSLEEYTAPSGKRAYKPYATEADQLLHTAVAVTWTYKDTIRTQVSRQYGHGR